MKIIRNGQEFELTREELYDAYREMEHEYDMEDLETDSETLDAATEYGRTRTQFKKGNTQGVRFAPNNSNDDQITIDDEFFN